MTRTDLTRLAPFFAVGLVITVLDLSFYTSREPLSLGYSFVERVLIAARALWFYVGKLLWPVDLAVIYPLWDISPANPVAWTYVLAAAALAALLWFGRRRLGRGPLAGALFFAVTLSPALGFVDYGYMQFSLVADRFQYLAGLGVLAVLLGAAVRGAGRLPALARTGAAGVLVLVLGVLGTLTWRQAGIYRDEVALVSHIAAINPEARDAHLNLADPLFDAGRHEEALAAARTSVEQRPDSADAHSGLGGVLVRLNLLDEAEAVLRKAVELAPRHLDARQNLGEALRKQGRFDEAVEMYRGVLETDGDLARGHAGLGMALFDRTAEAAAQFERAIERDPNHAEALDYLALWRFGQREYAGALDLYRVQATLRPDSAAVHANIAVTLYSLGRREEALVSLQRVLRLDPEHETALRLKEELSKAR